MGITAQYDEALARDYAHASALAYCNAGRVMQRGCRDATKMTEQIGIKPIHSMDNGSGFNPISYTIMLRESKKEIIVGFSGTILTQQLVNEILDAIPVRYRLHLGEGVYVFDYFYTHYLKGFRVDFILKVI